MYMSMARHDCVRCIEKRLEHESTNLRATILLNCFLGIDIQLIR